jgi:hypothetical protein
MRGFSGRGGGLGRLGVGQFATLSDGTVVVGNSAGVAVPAVPAGSQEAQVPGNAGGGMVQGKGLDFKYQTPVVLSLAPGASAQRTIQFDQNSTFNWLRTTYSVNVTGDVEEASLLILPLVTLQITDQGNGMAFMNSPIPLYTMAGGTGSLPYVLPTPQLIQPNASFIYQFASYAAGGGSTYINLSVQFHGYRIFNSGQA